MMSSIPRWVGDLVARSLRPTVTILGTSYISPSLKKIRFQGNRFEWDFQIGYANAIRVSDTKYRNYTVAHQDTNAGVLDIIVHIHGQGVGSHYIDSLQGLERKHLTLRTRLKRLTSRTICYSKSVVVHDTAIGLFINQFFFADQRS